MERQRLREKGKRERDMERDGQRERESGERENTPKH